MDKTVQKIEFITEYLTSYQTKIKTLNKVGLFDNATHFELFAMEVCKIWFNTAFINLNTIKLGFPYVDLKTEDGSIYVQVSTIATPQTKITETLNKIVTSEDSDFQGIQKVIFVMLDSSSKLKKQTKGNISFDPKEDLITIKDIVQKANSDLNFQNAIYNLLQNSITHFEEELIKYEQAIDKSKFDISQNVNSLINNEYEIDRTPFIDAIFNDDKKNVVILGEAGFGKSVICKKIIETKEDTFLYTRAEQLVQSNYINDIWNFNIDIIFNYLGSKKLIICIDALEFIADNYKRNNLLQYLLSKTKPYNNIKIIMSCRTSDFGAFMKVENEFDIKKYEIQGLSDVDIFKLSNRYPIIKKIKDSEAYAQLLRNPLYIDLMITKINNLDNINDENQFREHIWNSIICLDNNDKKLVVKEIVFNRAKNFLLYVSCDEMKSSDINELVSNGILIKNELGYRLKYDIFEDICFEQYFDERFNHCRGKYKNFFEEIEELGNSIYRRYQIWIANKLLAKTNRQNFIYELVFGDTLPEKWQQESIIGLVKSRFSADFFNEYADDIVSKNLLSKFIEITNLYAFEVSCDEFRKQLPLIQLTPSGQGRLSLINIIYEKEIYKTINTVQTDIIKLISDFAKSKKTTHFKKTEENSCKTLQYYVGNLLSRISSENINLSEFIKNLLSSIYLMAESSKVWIKDFWINMQEYYKSNETKKEYVASDIIEYTLISTHTSLPEYLTDEICKLAEFFWRYRLDNPKKENFHKSIYSTSTETKYGLSNEAESYKYNNKRNTSVLSNFFISLLNHDFWKGLDWIVKFINDSVIAYSQYEYSDLFKCTIKFVEDGSSRDYLGNLNLWNSIKDNYADLPAIIQDMVVCTNTMIELKLRRYFSLENEIVSSEGIEFANEVKEFIYEKSNNIALLSVIRNIALRYPKKLKGFALNLISSVDLIIMDYSEPTSFSHFNRFPKRNDRDNLSQYMIFTLLYGDKVVVEKGFKILDYLYSEIPNDKENAFYHLQIQKMDIRLFKAESSIKDTISLVSQHSGEAAKINKEYESKVKVERELMRPIRYAQVKMKRRELPLEECEQIITDSIKNRGKFEFNILSDREIYSLMEYALSFQELNITARENYCELFLNGLEANLSSNRKYDVFPIDDYSTSPEQKLNSLMCESKYAKVLFIQLDIIELSVKIKNRIKKLMLESILGDGELGTHDVEIADYAKKYLVTNRELSNQLFNVIIKIAEDEMNYQKHNANYLIFQKKEKDFVFQPNLTRNLAHVDRLIQKNSRELYVHNKEQIIDDYLYNNKVCYNVLNINNLEINVLCRIVYTKINLKDDKIKNLIKEIISCFINIWNETKGNSWKADVLYFTTEQIILNYLSEMILEEEISISCIDLMFEVLEPLKNSTEIIKFYIKVFSKLSSYYFDAYKNSGERDKYYKVFEYLESKITSHADDTIKMIMYKSLLFPIPEYSADWSKCNTNYSFQDKKYINSKITKYGWFHLEDVLNSVYQLQIYKLLPEIIISLSDTFKSLKEKDEKNLQRVLYNQKYIIIRLISCAFLQCSEEIKENDKLTQAFEDLLMVFIDYRFEEAAVIRDKFRIH